MSDGQLDRLYNLLPAVYRLRDSAQGEPLRALFSLIQQQYDAVEQDISGLYENWFIETCAEWVVPYIGDLLGVRPLYAASPDTFSARVYVANTLEFRRRKGTAAMLELLALDVTGWPAHAVEFFQLLATTQYMNHLRPSNVVTPDLRDSNQLELLGGPFDQVAHTVDVRQISRGGGKYNIPNLGIFLWRLADYQIGPIATDLAAPARQGDARAVASPPDGRYTFDPLGTSAPLFNLPQTQTGATGLVTETNVPGLLRRRPLYDELEALRQAEVDSAPNPTPVYFGANPVFQVLRNGALVPFDRIMICDISDVSATDWRRPAASKPYTPSAGGAAVNKKITLSVDPLRGRIAFPAGVKPSSVVVSYTYGFSGNLGAGPYDRTSWLTDPQNGPAPFNDRTWQVGISREIPPLANLVYPTFGAAVQAWSQQPAGTQGIIAVLDSRTYREDLSGTSAIVVPEGSRLLIVAADWEAARQTGAAQPRDLTLGPNGVRPHFLGAMTARGTAPATSPNPGELYIDGLLLEGTLTIDAGNLGTLGVSHTTIGPQGGLSVASSGAPGGENDGLTVRIYRSVCGPIALSASVPALNTVDSIINSGPASAATAAAISAAGATASIGTTTVFGTTNGLIIGASDSLFTGAVTATRQQSGCLRFCYVPVGSQTARRYHCQPDLALADVAPAAQGAIVARLTPQFTSTDFGQPGYAQLSLRCPSEITNGADNGSEVGAFCFLLQPQRLANLQTALDEYLRFGLEAGVIQET
jgi:hypothetical protein